MILSTNTNTAIKRLGGAKAVELIAKAGFDALDYSMFDKEPCSSLLHDDNYEKGALDLKDVATQWGVYFNQAHAPFPSYIENDDVYNKEAFAKIIKSMEIASILGADSIVVHPFFAANDKKKRNIEFYNQLLPYCKQLNIKVALENMWGHDKKRDYIIANVCSTPNEFNEYLDALDSDYFTGCLDIGHCPLVGVDSADAIRAMGNKRITALHVHDNNYKKDLHSMPYMDDLDWDSITTALKDVQYKGDFTFEVGSFFKNVPDDLLPNFYKLMHDVGRYLISKCEWR